MDSVPSWLRWPSTATTPQPSLALLVGTTAVATVTLLALGKTALWPRHGKVLRSPLGTVIPKTSKAELAKLVYQPDQFPGARDVETPYGSIRVYEFGPEDGEKVLFIHGISTTCITLTRIAHALVERGCRVMLFDLFGRGFSDGVGDLPHDARLYTTQALMALASSPLPWTGDNAIRLIGYSLGGGVAVHFANAFPNLVSSLVLLAPAGLIRAESFGVVTRFVFSSGLVPERILGLLTRRRLQRPIASGKVKRKHGTDPRVDIAAAEATTIAKGQTQTPLEHRVLDYVRWMVINHAGFVPAFMSSIRFAPLTDQQESWKQLAKRKPWTTAILLAEDDEIIDADDYAQDGLPLAGGRENVVWRVLPGNHDFVMTHHQDIMNELDELWEMDGQ